MQHMWWRGGQRLERCLAGMGASRGGPGEGDVQYVRQALAARGGPQVPHNFAQTAPGHDGTARRGRMPQSSPRSPQVGFTGILSIYCCPTTPTRVPQRLSAVAR